MKPTELNWHLCFNTVIGRQYIDQRFTLIALTFGNPEPLETFNYREFNEEFKKAFGVELATDGWGMLGDNAKMWIAAYCSWYKENAP